MKKALAHPTEIARPSAVQHRLLRADQHRLPEAKSPESYRFKDDGRTPNNPRLSLAIYRDAMVFDPRFNSAAQLELRFASNGWTGSWRDSMYRYNHFHTQTHEVLGLARGRLLAKFGGSDGREIELATGDVVIIPAGIGHKRINSSNDLLIVGAYPKEGKYDEPRPGEINRKKAIDRIAEVAMPETDPVFGKTGPLLIAWGV